MSHAKERKEKDCLNCGAEVQGRYCHICGQENIETSETFWGLVTHFAYDITHFDGKFFSSLKYLLLRPGFLSLEYKRGKRNSYLHPIKMYVFTSALFFFVFFSMNKNDVEFIKVNDSNVEQARASLLKKMVDTKDSVMLMQLADSLRRTDTIIVMLEEMQLMKPDPTLQDSVRSAIRPFVTLPTNDMKVATWSGLASTLEQYDSLEASKPASKRHGWFKRYYTSKAIQLNAKFRYDKGQLLSAVLGKFLHSLPQMMFISMPFLAMFISLLYIRQKKTNYVHHGILVFHGYIAMYILILIAMLASYIQSKTHSGFASFAVFILVLYMVYYNYKSLRNYFGQTRGKTLLKFSGLLLLTLLLFSMLSSIFVINSLLQA